MSDYHKSFLGLLNPITTYIVRSSDMNARSANCIVNRLR